MTVSVLNRSYNSFNLYDREIEDDEFFALCQRNPNHKLEKNPDGTVIIMPNTGGKTGKRNSKINLKLSLWEEANGGNV